MSNKLEVGDKIHVEYTIERNNSTDTFMVVSKKYCNIDGVVVGATMFAIHPHDPAIVKVIPKPFEVKIGDCFYYDTPNRIYEILGVDGDYCWYRYEMEKGKIFYLTCPVSIFKTYQRKERST